MPKKRRGFHAHIYLLAALALLMMIVGGVVYAFEMQRPYTLTSEVEAELNDQAESSTPHALRIPIIIYHSIQPGQPGETLMEKRFDISPALLDKQLAYLKAHGYTTISLRTLAHDLEVGTTSPVVKPVVVTFDDGWQDDYTQAFPLLKKYGDTATFYVYTNPIGKDPRFLTWAELQEMDAAGMTIGSHTLSHPQLASLSGSQLHDEIFNSKKIIEQHLGKSVTDFASPFGSTNATIDALVAQAGYTTSRTGNRGAYHTKNDLLDLSAYYAPTTMSDFAWLIAFAP